MTDKIYTFRPLKWVGTSAWVEADCILGRYYITAQHGSVRAMLHRYPMSHDLGDHATIEDAQLACWQDYEQRISAALQEVQS